MDNIVIALIIGVGIYGWLKADSADIKKRKARIIRDLELKREKEQKERTQRQLRATAVPSSGCRYCGQNHHSSSCC